jgi:hypothetical protein
MGIELRFSRHTLSLSSSNKVAGVPLMSNQRAEEESVITSPPQPEEEIGMAGDPGGTGSLEEA